MSTEEVVEKVMLKLNKGSKHKSTWFYVNEKRLEDHTDDVFYETKNVNQDTCWLKIENLKERENYEVSIQTNIRQHVEKVTVYGMN